MSITERFSKGVNYCPIKNMHQGIAPRVLFVCSAGLLRSPTAAAYANSSYGWNTRSAGSEPAYALIPVTQTLLDWADMVVFVNEENEHSVLQSFAQTFKSVTIDVEDSYDYMDPDLLNILHRELAQKVVPLVERKDD